MQKPFDPLELAKETEQRFVKGNKRRYYSFRVEPFYQQIATARGPGCDLRCAFCWTDPSKDNDDVVGKLYSPQEVYDNIIRASSNEFGKVTLTEGVRISGFEPTIGRQHLLEVIDVFKKDPDHFHWFLLETNGILLGADESYVQDLSRFGDYLQVRLSIKAGTPDAFERKTGARAEFSELPWKALDFLRKYGIKHRVAAMSQDPAFVPQEERRQLIQRLASYHEPKYREISDEDLLKELGRPSLKNASSAVRSLEKTFLATDRIQLEYPELLDLEEESMTLYGLTRRRMAAAGFDVNNIGKRRYVSDDLKLVKLSRSLGISLEKLIESTIFPTEPVSEKCKETCRMRPWHGYGVEDDLDPKLN